TSTQLVWLPPDSKAATSRLPGWSPPDSVAGAGALLTLFAGVEPRIMAWLPLKGLHTPVQSARWLLPKYGPRIGDFIPPKSLRNLQATVPKQALPTKEETDKPVSSAL
ncbi:unnamed protein product, partial [Staurois parvus]